MSNIIRTLLLAKLADELSPELKKNKPLVNILREHKTEPVYFVKRNAFLLIMVKEERPFFILKREWGVAGGLAQRIEERFSTRKEAKEQRDIIVKHKLRKGYIPIF